MTFHSLLSDTRPPAAAGALIQPKEPRDAARPWFSRHPGIANESEVLFLALVRVWNAENVPQQLEWASQILVEESRLLELGDAWRPQNGAAWEPNEKKLGSLLTPMLRQLRAAASTGFLEQACKAMQSLHNLPGQCDGLNVNQLRYWLREPPREPGASKKKGGGGIERWKGRALVAVAKLVKRHGPALRRALQLKEAIDDVPSAAAVISELTAKVKTAETEREKAVARSKKSADAHRKAQTKLVTKKL
jgi:hypothetical protein